MQNISKYIQINDYILLEYQFTKEDETYNVKDLGALLIETNLGFKQYIEQKNNYITNNNFIYNSLPENIQKSEWFYSFITQSYINKINIDNSIILSGNIKFDVIKLHILSGYQFEDIDGFIVQINAESKNNELITLSNFTWNKYLKDQFNKSLFFSKNTLFLGSKTYDKYVEFKIPSIYELGKSTSSEDETNIIKALNIKSLDDIKLSFSTIPANSLIVNKDNTYVLNNTVSLQFPTVSVADNFNCVIFESTNGDYIEYYATWNDYIIGNVMNDIETNKISLYTSNTPNDNYLEFEELWGDARKWVLIHDIEVREFIIGGSSVVTQRLSFTQDDNFNYPNLYRPIIINSDASSYNITYTCRLINRLDGSQIIRKSSFSSNEPRKYAKIIKRLNTNNLINYAIFNKNETTETSIITPTQTQKVKYVKVYYDATNIVLDSDGYEYTQGTGPLYLKRGGGYYKFNFYNLKDDEKFPIDLSGMYGYRLCATLSNGEKITVDSSNSTNMNTTLGQLEFKLSDSQVESMLNSSSNDYTIQLKNVDDTFYTFYQGKFYDIKNKL